MTRQRAFLQQARSDFVVFVFLAQQNRRAIPECHALHYLQMSTEKLAKAAFAALGVTADPFSHVAFSHLPHLLDRADLARALGFKDQRAFRRFLTSAARLFRAIEEVSPAIGPSQPGGGPSEGPNAEYPWRGRDSRGEMTWILPADHYFGLLDELLRRPQGRPVLQFIRTVLDRFEAIFP